MAKTKKKQSKARPQVWQAQPDDAIRLAALRWLAISIERLTIEIYATDKQQFQAMEDVLRKTVKRLRKISKAIDDRDEEDCPIGYELCKDGLCAPMCDGVAVES